MRGLVLSTTVAALLAAGASLAVAQTATPVPTATPIPIGTPTSTPQLMVLVTAALQLGDPTLGENDYNALCTATNVSGGDLPIQLVMFDGQGVRTAPPTPAPNASPTPTAEPIGYLQTAILGDDGYPAPGSALAGLRYCMIIFRGDPEDVRTSFCITQRPVGACVGSVVEGR